MRVVDHPSMVKDGSGWGAMTGLSAAYLAADGFTGAPALTVQPPTLATIRRAFGPPSPARVPSFPPYPGCPGAAAARAPRPPCPHAARLRAADKSAPAWATCQTGGSPLAGRRMSRLLR